MAKAMAAAAEQQGQSPEKCPTYPHGLMSVLDTAEHSSCEGMGRALIVIQGSREQAQ